MQNRVRNTEQEARRGIRQRRRVDVFLGYTPVPLCRVHSEGEHLHYKDVLAKNQELCTVDKEMHRQNCLT